MFSFHSCHQRAGKRPLNMILSVTHGFIYSVLHTVFTPAFDFPSSLSVKGPFTEGSYCKSPQLRASIGFGPFFFLMCSQTSGLKWLTLPTETAYQHT